MKIGYEEVIAVSVGEDIVTDIIQNNETIYSGETTPSIQSGITLVDDIEAETMGWNINNHIVLPYTMTTSTSMRVIAQYAGMDNDRVVGFSWEDDGSTISDEEDCRPFFLSGYIYFDLNAERLYTVDPFLTTGNDFDLTFGNYYIYDNSGSTQLFAGTTQSAISRDDVYIRVDVSTIFLKGVQIRQNGTLVFDGKAAIQVDENDNTSIGLYDTVGGEFYTNTAITMTYNGACDGDAQCLCEATGGTWDSEMQECQSGDTPDDPVDPCEGMDPGECMCIQMGGMWNGVDCEFPEPPEPDDPVDPCEGDPQCQCEQNGGTWNPEDMVCE